MCKQYGFADYMSVCESQIGALQLSQPQHTHIHTMRDAHETIL